MTFFSKTLFLSLSLAIATAVPAQTQLLRGKVEDVRNTQNQFFLDGTSIPLVSSTFNLNLLMGRQVIMQVVDVGTGGKTVLDVRAATPTVKMFDMGNLRFGRAERWQVNAQPGSRTAVYVAPSSLTSYAPVGPIGTWLLGPVSPLLASGTVNNFGQFEFRFTMPTIPSLVGMSVTAQAVVQDGNGSLTLTNPDSKEVRAK